MKCYELIEELEKLAPPSLAEEWDNVGLLAGSRQREVKRIYVSLDATDEVIDEALNYRADILLTHHPLIFKPLKRVTEDDLVARRVMKMIAGNMSNYAMHTNFDAAPGCMADLAAGRLGLENCRPLVPAGDGGCGIGKLGFLLQPMDIGCLAEKVKEAFQLPFLTVYGDRHQEKQVRFVAISPGSGGSMMPDALAAGAEVMISGDIDHHRGIDAGACGMTVMDAGHYGLEHIFIEFMREWLVNQFGKELEVRAAGCLFPAFVIS